MQPPLALVEPGRILHVRRAKQSAVEGIRPGVIGALDAAAESPGRSLAEPRAAMPAGVVQCVHPPVAIPHDHEALAGDLDATERARVRELARAPDARPVSREDGL